MASVTNFAKVKEFMETFGQNVKEVSTWPNNPNTKHLRIDLIGEELNELMTAVSNDDFTGIANALTDILYVTYGAGHTFGINLDACFQEVHSSNMSKLGEDGKPIYNEDGKVLKGPNYREPDLKSILGEISGVPNADTGVDLHAHRRSVSE